MCLFFCEELAEENRITNDKYIIVRELRAHVFLGPDSRKIEISDPGPVGPRPGAFSTNIQHPVCTWIYRDDDLTT